MSIPKVVPAMGPAGEQSARASNFDGALALLTVLFAGRVAAQALQRWLPIPLLPPFGAFQGSSLPYAVLLPAQLAIIAVMLRIVWRVRRKKLERSERTGRALTVLGGLYVAVMLTRLVIGFAVPDAPAWFRCEISIAFHFVLAIFVLTLAAYHGGNSNRTTFRIWP